MDRKKYEAELMDGARKDLANKLSAARRYRAYAQMFLTEKSGIRQHVISGMEKGEEGNPSLRTLVRLADDIFAL